MSEEARPAIIDKITIREAVMSPKPADVDEAQKRLDALIEFDSNIEDKIASGMLIREEVDGVILIHPPNA